MAVGRVAVLWVLLEGAAGLAVHPHARMTTPELIAARGYPVEVHHVTTEDGYILEMHRIPGPCHAPPPTATHDPLSKVNYDPPPTATHDPPSNATHDPSSKSTHDPLNPTHDPTLNPTHDPPLNATYYPAPNGNYTGRVGGGGARVVFLLHGVLASSADFVLNDPHQALGYVLADAGYDVWLGNIRGNVYGRRHASLSPAHPAFWQFSWDEIGRYDVPAMLGYVRATSGATTLNYVGHSLGNSVFFIMVNIHPHINHWVRVMAALAPAAYLGHMRSPLALLAPVAHKLEKVLQGLRMYELSPRQPWQASLMASMCSPVAPSAPLCAAAHALVSGPSSHNLDPDYLAVVAAHNPAGVGYRVMVHLLQQVGARRFAAFDFGVAGNLAHYNQSRPPDWCLACVSAPVALFWAPDDWLAVPQDVARTRAELGHVVLDYRVPRGDFNHQDFMWADTAAALVYQPLLRLLQEN